mgnify:CR=1 FL=1
MLAAVIVRYSLTFLLDMFYTELKFEISTIIASPITLIKPLQVLTVTYTNMASEKFVMKPGTAMLIQAHDCKSEKKIK